MIIDAVKEYLVRKGFGTAGYLCVICYILCGSALIIYTGFLAGFEKENFSCQVDDNSTTVHKKQVDQSCFTKYHQAYNSPLPLFGFVLVCTLFGVLVSIIYSQRVSNRVNEIESIHERQNPGRAESQEQDRRTVHVFHWYCGHLVFRAFLGILFTVLQYTCIYSSGFPVKFNCNYKGTVVSCKNATASQKSFAGILVCVTNCVMAFVIFGEVIYVCVQLSICNHRHEPGWNLDYEFVTSYLLGKPYVNRPDECLVEPLLNITDMPTSDRSITGEHANTRATGNNSQPGQNNLGPSAPISNCNEPVHSYCSRKKLDNEIQRIQKGKLKLLHGPIGTGKTSAALHYIFKNQKTFAVSWRIDVSSSEASILQELEHLAEKLGVSYDELFRPALEQKAEENEIIFFLDNLQKEPRCEWFKRLWSIRRLVYVIATTNSPYLNLPDTEQIHVEKFDEALEFLEPLRSKNSEEDLLELCRHFDWNIMGLSVAQDYMLKHKRTARIYLQRQRNREAAKSVRKDELKDHNRILYLCVRTCLEEVDDDKFSAIAATSFISNHMIPEFLLSNLLSSSSQDVNHLKNEAHLDELHDQLKSLVRITEENGFRFFSLHSFTQNVIRDMLDEQKKASLLYQLAGIFMRCISKDNRFSKEDFIQRTIRAHAEKFLEEWRNKKKDDRIFIALARLSELVGFTYTQQQPPLQQKLDDHFVLARDLLHELCGVTEDDLQPAEGLVREIWGKFKGRFRQSPLESSSDEESKAMYGITNNDLVIAYQLFTKLSKKSLKLSADVIEELAFLRTVNKKDLHMFPEIVTENQTVEEKFDPPHTLSASDVCVLVNNGAAYSVDQYRKLFLPELYLSLIYSFGRNYFYKNKARMENPHFYIGLLKLAYCLSREISKRMKPNAVFHEFLVQMNGLLYLPNDDYENEDGTHMKKDAQVHVRDLKIAIDRYQQLLRDERAFFEMGILKKTKDDTYSKQVCYRQMLRCYTNLLSLKNGEDRNQCIEIGVNLCDDFLKFLDADDDQYTCQKKEDIVQKSRHMNAIADFYLTVNHEKYHTLAIKIFTISAEHAEKYDPWSLFYLEALVGLADVFSRNGKHRFSATQVSIRHLIHCNSTESLREMQRQKPHIQQRIRKIQIRNLGMVFKKCALLRREQNELKRGKSFNNK